MPKISLETAKELVPVLMKNVLNALKDARLHTQGASVLVSSEECSIMYISVYDYDVPNARIMITMNYYNGTHFEENLVKFIKKEYTIESELVRKLLHKLYNAFMLYIEFYKRVQAAYKDSFARDEYGGPDFRVRSIYNRADTWCCDLTTDRGGSRHCEIDSMDFYNVQEYV